MAGYFIYMYSDQNDIPFYIGKGKGNRWRPSHHVHNTRSHVSGKIKSIGIENVKVYFLYRDLTEEEAFKYERYYISVFGRKDNGTGILTNHTDGGEGSGYTPSEETKQKISEALMGHFVSKETKRKIGKGLKGKKRTPFSEETKQKMKEASARRWRK